MVVLLLYLDLILISMDLLFGLSEKMPESIPTKHLYQDENTADPDIS